MNRVLGAALAALLLSIPCAAQSADELLQKGIYLQETEGNQDAAIQIYRQITAAAGQSPVAVQAQYRIAQAMLQKGDLNAASLEFSTLAARYPDGKALVARLASTGRLDKFDLQPALDSAVRVELTQLQRLDKFDLQPALDKSKNVHNGIYRDEPSGLQFPVPAAWTMVYDGKSSSDGNMVGFLAPGSHVDYGVWMKPNDWLASEIPAKLRGALELKARDNSGRDGFVFRPENVEPHTVGGQQALSAVGEYFENGRKMVNYYFWVYTPKTHAVFLAREVPAEDLPTVKANLDSLVATAQVP